jgi:methylmalonyl-CoA mutase N-terminal domain/subunit
VLAGALGGAQSIHANGYDEGICLPTDQSMLLSIRTEQIAGLETNVTNTIDPLGGSYYVESLTSELEKRSWEYVRKIENMGGMAKAMSSGWVHREYKEATLEHERKVETGEINVVGVNKFRLEKAPYTVPIFRWDPESPRRQIEELKKFKKERDNSQVAQALKKLEQVTRTSENIYPAVMEAAQSKVTLGEMAEVQMRVYGEWKFPIGL